MRHVSRTHRVALDWLFDRINSDPKIQIKCIDSKNQLADTFTKGNFTRDEWNHLFCLFNTSHFSSTDCSEVMSLSSVIFLHQKARGRQRYESQSPLTMQADKNDRTGKPVVCRDTNHEHHHHRPVESTHADKLLRMKR